MRRMIERAHAVVAISAFTRNEILNKICGIEKEVKVIYNGVHVPETFHIAIPDFIENPHEKFFFTVGEVKKRKNFHVLLDLMKLMPEYKLYIAGSNSSYYAKEMEKRIIFEHIDNVRILGQITDAEKLWMYKNCTAFFFPSLLEGFGLPVIEAMMFGKPVFTTRSTSLPEIGGEVAFYWDDFHPEVMLKVVKDNLAYYHATPHFKQKLQNHAATFSYERHFEQYLDLYRSL
jgi:glycosyltransferase involved in cell wall biosynthesis